MVYTSQVTTGTGGLNSPDFRSIILALYSSSPQPAIIATPSRSSNSDHGEKHQ